jgi:hypothetical protein
MAAVRPEPWRRALITTTNNKTGSTELEVGCFNTCSAADYVKIAILLDKLLHLHFVKTIPRFLW